MKKLFIPVLILLLCAISMAGVAEAALNVALYKRIPDYDSFQKTIEDCWKKLHPDIELLFSDWDCYSGEAPDDLDVFVFDAISLDAFANEGYLLPLSEEDIQDYDDLIPSFVEGCRVNGGLYGVPQLVCNDFLFTRKQDDEMKAVQSLDELYEALKDEDELLLDKDGRTTRICLYLYAMIDENQQYMDTYPPIEEGNLSPEALAALVQMKEMRLVNPEGADGSQLYYYATEFADGKGRAYIGFSETMSAMGESASEMDFRLFSMTDDEDIPVFYADVVAVNAKISEEKKKAALELMNLITGTDTLVRLSKNNGNPRYLLTARYSVYEDLEREYPIYKELKEIVSTPGIYIFRIKPDGDAYIEQAKENLDLLPVL